ncbi:hypothetical protein FBU30_005581 [Linnemannia zychae]|nr:hypothetical protein FBU30_005581 [Linnemannia zychae]
MLFKSAAVVLAFAGLVAAQGAAPELKHGSAKVTAANNANTDIEALFTFDKVNGGMNITVSATKGLSFAAAVNKTAGYEYHIHVNPVGPNNNCTSTGGHLDPLNVGPAPCNPANLTSCQTGDLSGKHGNLNGTENGAIPLFWYLDTQLSFTTPANGPMVGRSVVIHNNGTRIACGNLVVDGYTAPAGNQTDNGSKPSPNPAGGNNSATKLIGSAALTGFVAIMMMAL